MPLFNLEPYFIQKCMSKRSIEMVFRTGTHLWHTQRCESKKGIEMTLLNLDPYFIFKASSGFLCFILALLTSSCQLSLAVGSSHSFKRSEDLLHLWGKALRQTPIIAERHQVCQSLCCCVLFLLACCVILTCLLFESSHCCGDGCLASAPSIIQSRQSSLSAQTSVCTC